MPELTGCSCGLWLLAIHSLLIAIRGWIGFIRPLLSNQDTMPKGGVGNLIALPLQKLPRADGNSVFVDEEFHPYGNQWAFLASMKRMPISAAEAVVLEAQPLCPRWHRQAWSGLSLIATGAEGPGEQIPVLRFPRNRPSADEKRDGRATFHLDAGRNHHHELHDERWGRQTSFCQAHLLCSSQASCVYRRVRAAPCPALRPSV